MHEIKLTQADNGKTVDLPSGSELLVSLPENPSTGYTWTVDVDGKPTTGLLNSSYVPDTPLTPGSGGQHVFRFGIRQMGIAQLQLKRWHEWEGNASVVERFNITVRVAP